MAAEKPFDVAIDREHRIITIQGIRYAFDLFDALGFRQVGTQFEIVKRGDGVIVLRTLAAAGASVGQ